MSFTYKKRGRREVLYFQAGRQGTFYIMPRDSPDDVKVENVEKALRYMQSRMTGDKEIYQKLVNLLPKERRKHFQHI
ncbi:MAG: hypothetical protein ACREBU_03020 [Nitrososphaera sp.]